MFGLFDNFLIHNSAPQKMWIKNWYIILDIAKKNVSELRSETVLRLGVFAEVDVSTISLSRQIVVGLSQDENVESDDSRGSKILVF